MTAKEKADMTISLDADLQDDVDVIDQMVEKYYEGNDVVYGVRSARKTDTFFKKFTAQGFYKVMQAMGVEIVYNHADYRLMSRRALEGLAEFKEVNLFLRGIVPLIGYQSDVVTYERHERFAGESKYPLKKMLAFATDGITSFSIKPIRMITTCGILIFGISILMFLYFLRASFYRKHRTRLDKHDCVYLGDRRSSASGNRIVGEYIGKIYLETKERPKYIIETVLDK